MIEADTEHKAQIEEQEGKRISISKAGRYSSKNNESGYKVNQCSASDSGSYVLREEENMDVYACQLNISQSSNPTIDMQVNGRAIRLHVDTQADITVMVEGLLKQMRNTTLEPTRVKVKAYLIAGRGLQLPILGKFNVRLSRGEKRCQRQCTWSEDTEKWCS